MAFFLPKNSVFEEGAEYQWTLKYKISYTIQVRQSAERQHCNYQRRLFDNSRLITLSLKLLWIWSQKDDLSLTENPVSPYRFIHNMSECADHSYPFSFTLWLLIVLKHYGRSFNCNNFDSRIHLADFLGFCSKDLDIFEKWFGHWQNRSYVFAEIVL